MQFSAAVLGTRRQRLDKRLDATDVRRTGSADLQPILKSNER